MLFLPLSLFFALPSPAAPFSTVERRQGGSFGLSALSLPALTWHGLETLRPLVKCTPSPIAILAFRAGDHAAIMGHGERGASART